MSLVPVVTMGRSILSSTYHKSYQKDLYVGKGAQRPYLIIFFVAYNNQRRLILSPIPAQRSISMSSVEIGYIMMQLVCITINGFKSRFRWSQPSRAHNRIDSI